MSDSDVHVVPPAAVGSATSLSSSVTMAPVRGDGQRVAVDGDASGAT
jgi:hypothetical protein